MKTEDFYHIYDILKCGTDLTSEQVNSCLDTIKGMYIQTIEKKEELDNNDHELLGYLSGKDGIAKLTSNDVGALVFQMASTIREKSHGAAILSKVFIHKDLYDSISDQIGIKNAKLRVNGVYIYMHDGRFARNQLIGVCRSKFNNMSYEQLLVLGNLKSEQ